MATRGRKSKINRSDADIVRDPLQEFRFEFGDRLRSVLDAFENRAAAAKVAEVTAEHLASYLSGKTKPPFELIARLAKAQDVSLDWLATGEGERSAKPEAPDGFVAIPVQRDADTRFDDADTSVFARSLLAAGGAAPDDKLRVVIHRGNSNAPAIRDGDALLVDTSVARIGADGLYVFARDGKFQARFAETFVDDRVVLKSRNPEYGQQVLSPDEAARLQVFGRAFWRGGPI